MSKFERDMPKILRGTFILGHPLYIAFCPVMRRMTDIIKNISIKQVFLLRKNIYKDMSLCFNLIFSTQANTSV
jgi:hypothetical protein